MTGQRVWNNWEVCNTPELEAENAKLRVALNELVEACEYVKPFAGAVAVKASVKDIRQAGRFVKAVEQAKALMRRQGEDT